jgi:hypothetical protein
MRLSPFRPAAFLFLSFLSAIAADYPKALPVMPPTAPINDSPMNPPGRLDTVTFEFHDQGETHKITVTSSPSIARFDDLTDGYSFLYNPATQFYTGLEHRNYTYWEFSWPEVKAAVENSKRGEKRLQDLGNEGLDPDAPSPATNAPAAAAPDTSALGNGDNSGYVWRPAAQKKTIAGLPCSRWTGETLSGENCEVWCVAGPVPKVTAALAQLRTVNAPMALVPVREIAPDFIFPVYDALTRAGVTPIEINWGSGAEKSTFRVVEQKTREGKPALFAVPKLYVKTTLITMDGMTDAQPAPDLRGSRTAPRVDHLTPTPQPGAMPPLPGQ